MTRFRLIPSAMFITCAALQSAAAGEQVAVPNFTAKDAGQRYGQALGAIEVCHGSKLTPKASNLAQSYTGAELEAFKAAAAGVFEAWNGVKNCVNAADPNQCKIIMDKSCLSAEAEIGAAGKAFGGLVEFAKY